MHIFKQIKDLERYLAARRKEGKSIGFVPTMGALHQGHISLLRKSKAGTDCTVCSIFVNPTQFNEASDLDRYPRTPEKDILMLTQAGCQVLFMPSVEEVYPGGKLPVLNLDFGHLATTMEGAHRPGHFQGVAQVMKRLMDIVRPDKLFMGQKDFQQVTVVGYLLSAVSPNAKLVVCPTIRESDGLAMSSRNTRLSPEQRALAPLIFQALTNAASKIHSHFPRDIQQEALEMLAVPGIEVEYFEVVDGRSLRPIELFEDTNFAVACTAIRMGEIRLIDNLVLKEEE